MELENFKKKLQSYTKNDIIITDHAKVRAITRDIELKEVKENIINPERLVAIKEIPANNPSEGKFECYFAYTKYHCHKYILTINGKIIIVTIISINRDWQKMIK